MFDLLLKGNTSIKYPLYNCVTKLPSCATDACRTEKSLLRRIQFLKSLIGRPQRHVNGSYDTMALAGIKPEVVSSARGRRGSGPEAAEADQNGYRPVGN